MGPGHFAIGLAAIALLFFRNRRTSIIIGLVVFSHWVLDFIVHLKSFLSYSVVRQWLGSGSGLFNPDSSSPES